MSILETFYILFKTDADEAVDDLKKVDDASDQAEAGLKKVDKAAGGVGASFINMAKSIAAPLLALASFGSLMNIAVARAADIRQLDQFASKLNSNISDVDAFKRSVTGVGGEAAGAVDSLVKLGEKVNEAFSDKDSGARKDFAEWGLAFKDAEGGALGASDAMLELAGNLEGVSRAEALARIKKLGIEDAGTIDLILRGRRALEERIEAEKKMGVVTEDQARKVREYYAELGEVQNLLSSIGNQILGVFLPIATQAVDIFGGAIRWMMENQRLVEGFFIGLASVLALKYTPAMIQAGWATLAALWPYIALGAAVVAVGAAFALAYEDVRAFMDGQPSLIGALAEEYEWFGDLVESISDTFRGLGEAISATLTAADAGELGQIAQTLLSLDGLEASAIGVAALAAALSPLARTLMIFAAAFAAAKAGLDYLSSLKGDVDADIAARVAMDNPKAAPGYVEMVGTDEEGKFIYEDGNRRVDRPRPNPTAGFTDEAMDYKLQLMQEEGARMEASPMAVMEEQSRMIDAQLMQAKALLEGAAASPMNGQTTESLAPAVTNNDIKNTVNVGGVTVNTQATDAQGVAAAVDSALSSKLRETASQFDDGVAR
jgi:hypothetical protein